MQAELFVLFLTIYEVVPKCAPKNGNFINFEKKYKLHHVFVVGATAIKCPGLDHLYYKWELSEIPGSVVQTATTPFIRIDGYSFRSRSPFNKRYQLTVTLSHYTDMSAPLSFSDTFRFYQDNTHLELNGAQNFHSVTASDVNPKSLFRVANIPPSVNRRRASRSISNLTLKCLRNCNNPNPKEKTVFIAICTNCLNPEYSWTISPSIFPDQMDFGNGSQYLVIEQGVFKEGEVTISVNANGKTSSYPLTFKNEIKNGTCDITPKTGVSGVTIFEMNCIGFSSPHIDLTYEVYQKSEKANNYVMISEGKSQNINVLLSEGSSAEIMVRVWDSVYSEKEQNLTVKVNPGSVEWPSLHENRNVFVQIVSYLLDAVDKSNMADDEKMNIHKFLAEGLFNVSPNNFTSACQIISVLIKLQAFKLDADTTTSVRMAKSIQNCAEVVSSSYGKRNSPIPETLLMNLFNDVCSLSCKLAKKVPVLENILKEVVPVHDYDSYDEMCSSKLKVRDDLREITDSLFAAIQILGTTILRRNIPDEKPEIVTNDLMNFLTRRIKLSTLKKNQTITYLNSTGSKVFMPAPLIEELQKMDSIIDYQFCVMKKNLFWWLYDLNTDIVFFDLYRNIHKLHTFRNSFLVYLKAKNVPTGVLRGNIVTKTNIVAHRITMEENATLIIVFKPPSESYKVVASDCYCRKEDFRLGFVIRNDSEESERTLEVRPMGGRNTVYICILKSGSSVQYEGSFSMFSCNYWDMEIGKWNSGGCKLQKASLKNDSFMVCECTHASFFTGIITVPQNKLNSNLDLDFELIKIKNWIPEIFVMTAILFWVLLIVGAIFLDRKFKKRTVVRGLDDNVPGDPHAYLVVVFTGYYSDAGTTADVGFQILGEEANSRVHLMKCLGVTTLQRYSQDWFVMHTPLLLGELKKIRLWHNCKGVKPHWYCQRIIVQHLKSEIQYCFIVEKWFSLVWGSGKIYREIPVTKNRFLYPDKLLFTLNLEAYIKDEHIWLSIFTRDPHSNYTSMERVGALMTAFFTSLMTGALLNRASSEHPHESINPVVATFTLTNLGIIMGSGVWSLIVSVVIKLLFRHSSPNFKTPYKRTRVRFKRKEVICA